jgi:hypothetical protein
VRAGRLRCIDSDLSHFTLFPYTSSRTGISKRITELDMLPCEPKCTNPGLMRTCSALQKNIPGEIMLAAAAQQIGKMAKIIEVIKNIYEK